jgi:hypothetical protein
MPQSYIDLLSNSALNSIDFEFPAHGFGHLGLDRCPELFPQCLSLSKLLPFNNRPEYFPVVISRVEEVDIFGRSQVRSSSMPLRTLGGLETFLSRV